MIPEIHYVKNQSQFRNLSSNTLNLIGFIFLIHISLGLDLREIKTLNLQQQKVTAEYFISSRCA